MTLVVDPWHWLNEDGELPLEHPKLWPKLNRIGQFVDSGCDLEPNHGRETLLRCRRRQSGKPCSASMWVARQPDGALLCACPRCHHEEMVIHNWEDTLWAVNRMGSLPVLEPWHD